MVGNEKKTIIYHIQNDVITLYQGSIASEKNKMTGWQYLYGVFAKIKELAPNKNLHTIMDVQVCPNMKKVTLEKIVDVLENDTNEVILNDDFMQKALSPLKKMLELAK